MILSNYTFNKTARTVTITGQTPISIEGLKLITNLVAGVIIYQFNAPLKGGTVASNVITLEYDTSAMSNTDALMIIYDQPGDGELTVRIDEVTTYTYLGYAIPGTSEASAAWRVKRITNATGNILWADGNSNFDNIWANRVASTYV
jgi:hypothetical protein